MSTIYTARCYIIIKSSIRYSGIIALCKWYCNIVFSMMCGANNTIVGSLRDVPIIDD